MMPYPEELILRYLGNSPALGNHGADLEDVVDNVKKAIEEMQGLDDEEMFSLLMNRPGYYLLSPKRARAFVNDTRDWRDYIRKL